MPENKVPAHTNRPRLLSDISENPLSDTAIPEEYKMRRQSSSTALHSAGRHSEEQSGFYRGWSRSLHQSEIVNDSPTVSAPDPGIIGQPPQRTSSSNLLNHADRLQPPTIMNPQQFQPYNENRRSTPLPLPTFTTSPAGSEPISPSQSQDTPFKRSFSQTSLASSRNASRPRTPTPASSGLKGRGKPVPGSSSLPSSPKFRSATPHPYGKPSVKHLTCFWWKIKGSCRFAEDDCLYAHRDTGILADAPRQVAPGEPAKAGRHLEKAMENLRSKRNLSTSSLSASMVANPSTPEGQSTSGIVTTPVDTEALQERVLSLQADNQFLRGLVEQSSKEKSILMTTIEGLQKENSNLNQDVDFLKDVVNEIQQQHRMSGGTAPRNVSPNA